MSHSYHKEEGLFRIYLTVNDDWSGDAEVHLVEWSPDGNSRVGEQHVTVSASALTTGCVDKSTVVSGQLDMTGWMLACAFAAHEHALCLAHERIEGALDRLMVNGPFWKTHRPR